MDFGKKNIAVILKEHFENSPNHDLLDSIFAVSDELSKWLKEHDDCTDEGRARLIETILNPEQDSDAPMPPENRAIA